MTNIERRQFLHLCTAAALSTCIGGSASAEDAYTVVPTEAGRIRGRVKDGISSFLGVPYGRDTRLTRFQPPLPPLPWKDIRDAFVYGDQAPQMGTRHSARTESNTPRPEIFRLPPDEGAESEDCLHLNIWTPLALPAKTSRKPVLVYFHGGAFNGGTVNCALYDGTRLSRRGDVVVVTVNHRLNAF